MPKGRKDGDAVGGPLGVTVAPWAPLGVAVTPWGPLGVAVAPWGP